MRLLPSLLMLPLLLCLIIWMPGLSAQTRNQTRARDLDATLQDYAFRAFVRPRTGIVFTGTAPANLAGIKIAGLRLRSGSLRRRGRIGAEAYEEFEIPTGVIVSPYVERLVLVYQNLGNWSTFFYSLEGYTYLAPVLGLLAYDAVNLSAKNLPELNIEASQEPISIKFLNVLSVPFGSVAKCVWFDLQGNTNFSSATYDNICSATQQGHFSLVIETIAPSPAPSAPAPVPRAKNSKVWIIVGSILGGLAFLVSLALLLLWARKCRIRKKMQEMENASEAGEALRYTMIGTVKVPTALSTRTPPALENEYAP
uniref:Transmembrane protein n=1 Tax=Kalanchoe fedtschenkoi TaxID=63787 RepID=A0A7N0T2Z6_KALFE